MGGENVGRSKVKKEKKEVKEAVLLTQSVEPVSTHVFWLMGC